MEAIDVRGVSRSFSIGRSPLLALRDLDLRVEAGEVVAIVGPNGCGKSTLLRVISGLLPPDTGSVTVLGEAVRGVDPRVGLVFQEPRLLPWRDVLANVALPLELSGIDRPAREASLLVEQVGLVDAATGEPFRWRPFAMVYPVSPALREWFARSAYRSVAHGAGPTFAVAAG